jgi:outer membrane protein assembly factor BamE (lipoprotein component of BamABCDE complex)
LKRCPMIGWKHYLAAATITMLMLAFAIVITLPSGDSVTKANFDRIEKGMTLEQVQEIFGKHPDADGPFIIIDPPMAWDSP